MVIKLISYTFLGDTTGSHPLQLVLEIKAINVKLGLCIPFSTIRIILMEHCWSLSLVLIVSEQVNLTGMTYLMMNVINEG